MRTRQRLVGCLLLATLAAIGDVAAGSEEASGGIGVGAAFPQSDLAETNDTSYALVARTMGGKKLLGWRGGVYYVDTTAGASIDGGRAYGFDGEFKLKFGGSKTYGYVFVGAGYGKSTFTLPGVLPGSLIRDSQWDWSLNGGAGIVILRRVFLEASYVQLQTDPKISFVPVVVGIEF